MQIRSFLRIMFDSLYFNNCLFNSIKEFITYCNKSPFYDKKKLKFLEKMPLNNIKTQKNNYNTKNEFSSITINRKI